VPEVQLPGVQKPEDRAGWVHGPTDSQVRLAPPGCANSQKEEMKPEDIQLDVVPIQQKGGQHVGLIESKIRAKHIPTGLTASCSYHRSQMTNRSVCLAMLEYGLAEIGWKDE
jgi:protein subunit release factor A